VMFWRMTPESASLDNQVRGHWVNVIQPYLKNGGDQPDLATALTRKEPSGAMVCPSFQLENILKAAALPECASANYRDPQAILAHYAMAMQLRGGASRGTTANNPYYNFPGSGWSGTTPLLLAYSDVKRPAETVNIGDGISFIRNASIGTPRVNPQFGCESMFAHQGGANYVFLDGHAKYLKGNIERYAKQNSAGRWYMTYLTYEME